MYLALIKPIILQWSSTNVFSFDINVIVFLLQNLEIVQNLFQSERCFNLIITTCNMI